MRLKPAPASKLTKRKIPVRQKYMAEVMSGSDRSAFCKAAAIVPIDNDRVEVRLRTKILYQTNINTMTPTLKSLMFQQYKNLDFPVSAK